MAWKMAGNDIEASKIETIKKSYMDLCDTLSKREDLKITAGALKACTVQLVHRCKLDLEQYGHGHKMLLEIGLTGPQEKIDHMKWHLSSLTDMKTNKWKTRFKETVTE